MSPPQQDRHPLLGHPKLLLAGDIFRSADGLFAIEQELLPLLQGQSPQPDKSAHKVSAFARVRVGLETHLGLAPQEASKQPLRRALGAWKALTETGVFTELGDLNGEIGTDPFDDTRQIVRLTLEQLWLEEQVVLTGDGALALAVRYNAIAPAFQPVREGQPAPQKIHALGPRRGQFLPWPELPDSPSLPPQTPIDLQWLVRSSDFCIDTSVWLVKANQQKRELQGLLHAIDRQKATVLLPVKVSRELLNHKHRHLRALTGQEAEQARALVERADWALERINDLTRKGRVRPLGEAGGNAFADLHLVQVLLEATPSQPICLVTRDRGLAMAALINAGVSLGGCHVLAMATNGQLISARDWLAQGSPSGRGQSHATQVHQARPNRPSERRSQSPTEPEGAKTPNRSAPDQDQVVEAATSAPGIPSGAAARSPLQDSQVASPPPGISHVFLPEPPPQPAQTPTNEPTPAPQPEPTSSEPTLQPNVAPPLNSTEQPPPQANEASSQGASARNRTNQPSEPQPGQGPVSMGQDRRPWKTLLGIALVAIALGLAWHLQSKLPAPELQLSAELEVNGQRWPVSDAYRVPENALLKVRVVPATSGQIELWSSNRTASKPEALLWRSQGQPGSAATSPALRIEGASAEEILRIRFTPDNSSASHEQVLTIHH